MAKMGGMKSINPSGSNKGKFTVSSGSPTKGSGTVVGMTSSQNNKTANNVIKRAITIGKKK